MLCLWHALNVKIEFSVDIKTKTQARGNMMHEEKPVTIEINEFRRPRAPSLGDVEDDRGSVELENMTAKRPALTNPHYRYPDGAAHRTFGQVIVMEMMRCIYVHRPSYKRTIDIGLYGLFQFSSALHT